MPTADWYVVRLRLGLCRADGREPETRSRRRGARETEREPSAEFEHETLVIYILYLVILTKFACYDLRDPCSRRAPSADSRLWMELSRTEVYTLS